MTTLKTLESRWQVLLDSSLAPAVAGLPAAVPVERRHMADRHALMRRILSEFAAMPGLSLTMAQAARLFGLPPDIVSRILRRLIAARVLSHRHDGRFVLSGEEP